MKIQIHKIDNNGTTIMRHVVHREDFAYPPILQLLRDGIVQVVTKNRAGDRTFYEEASD